jgi:hypothetical protein
MRRTLSMGSSRRHWKMAECSESIGRIVAPGLARQRHQRPSGHHQRLLVGQGQDAPARQDALGSRARRRLR